MQLLFRRTACVVVILLLLLPRLTLAQKHAPHSPYKVDRDCAFSTHKINFNVVADDQPLQNADLTGMRGSSTLPVAEPARAHPVEVAESQRAYDDGQFAEAAEAVAEAAKQEPADPTVLYCYARALYRGPGTRELSYPVYQRLIKLLDTYGRESANTTVVYTLFSESYFKLGTLQLDYGLWALASYNLSRASLSMQVQPDLADPKAREQILQYQTECFSHLGNTKLCRYFGQRTLKFYPKNQYVRPYLSALPKASGKARP